MTKPIQIHVLDDFDGIGEHHGPWHRLDDAATISFHRDPIRDVGVLAQTLGKAEILILNRERTRVGRELLSQLANLRLIVTTGPWNAALDVGAAEQLGITVCGTEGLVHPPVELALGLMFDLARGISRSNDQLHRGSWQPAAGRCLRGAILGVVGLGRTGKEMVRIASALGMDVIAWSPTFDPSRARECGARLVAWRDLFSQSDFLSLHLILSEDTVGIVGSSELGLMKSSAYLINTARAALVDRAALVEALSIGALSGAASDVHWSEPVSSDDNILQCPNLILTPHIGGVVEEQYYLFFDQVVNDIEMFLAGTPIRTITQESNMPHPGREPPLAVNERK